MKDVFESTESELNELGKQNELLKDQLLEASLVEDIKHLVIASCVERPHKVEECKQNNPAEQVCLSGGDIYDDPSLLRFYQNDDALPWGNSKQKEGEDGPEWVVRSKFEDELANFMLEKKFHTKIKTLESEAPTFAITTRSGVSTRDPLSQPHRNQRLPTTQTRPLKKKYIRYARRHPVCGSDTRPPMLDKTDFESWQQRIRLYCLGKDNGENIMKSINEEGPFHMGTVSDVIAGGTKGAVQQGPVHARVLNNLSAEEKERYKADIRATNILLQGIPKDIYSLINHYTDAKDIWENVKMILEGSELTKDDR
ncbi:hypothetical protein Tco_0973379 [Tanacetum coccineum]